MVYKMSTHGGYALWATGKLAASAACHADMQTDGNFVVYGTPGSSNPLWSTQTNGRPGSHATMQSDGNFVVLQGTAPIFNTGTAVPEPSGIVSQSSGKSVLPQNSFLDGGQSASLDLGDSHLTMQNDCNLVLRVQGQNRWASDTDGKGHDCRFVMQADGNIVIYSGKGQVVWSPGWGRSSGPGLGGPTRLVLQPDNNVVAMFGDDGVIKDLGTQNKSSAAGGSSSQGSGDSTAPACPFPKQYTFCALFSSPSAT